MKAKKIKAMEYPYDTTVVSQKQFDAHMKLYHGYVDKVNQISELLQTDPEYATANATYGHFRCLEKGETYAIDGVILHEAYFQNMGGKQCKPGPRTKEILDESFGGYDKWKKCFIACGNSARGWAILCREQRTACCRNILLDSHDDGNIVMAFPLLVMDMYEHAYFLDYSTDKSEYINRFIENVKWDIVEKRVLSCE